MHACTHATQLSRLSKGLCVDPNLAQAFDVPVGQKEVNSSSHGAQQGPHAILGRQALQRLGRGHQGAE